MSSTVGLSMVPTGVSHSPGVRNYAFFVIYNGDLTNADGEFSAGAVYEYSCGQMKPLLRTLAIVIDIVFVVYILTAKSLAILMYVKSRIPTGYLCTKKKFAFRSPDVYYLYYACQVESDGNVGDRNGWSAAYSYGHFCTLRIYLVIVVKMDGELHHLVALEV